MLIQGGIGIVCMLLLCVVLVKLNIFSKEMWVETRKNSKPPIIINVEIKFVFPINIV